MNQTDLIGRIIATEQQAQALTRDARREHDNLDKTIDAELETLRRQYQNEAERYLEELRQTEREKSEAYLARLDQRFCEKLSRIDSIYAAQKDAWVDAIFHRIIGKAGD